MKHKKSGPCKDFDVSANFARPTAKCYSSMACSYYEENLTPEDAENDPQGPCKRRELVAEDVRTVDMFEEIMKILIADARAEQWG